MTRRLMILMIALAMGLAVPAWAGFDEGVTAYNKGDYKTALREWRPLAERGDAGAQYNLGLMYQEGDGVPQNYVEAVGWYRKAAEQGNVDAQNNLGLMYDKGHGAPRDHVEAARWYRKAAEQGYANAQNNLGYMYGNGLGLAQDYVQAHMWFNLAAAQGLEIARKGRDLVEKRMTPADVSRAQRMAREWRPKVQPKPDLSLALVQMFLKSRGYDTGPLDGLMGDRTRSAIASFKADMASAGTASERDRDLLELIEKLPK